jgi:electron transport complex protein RnfG
MKSQKKDIVKSIVVLVVICLVTSAALAIVNHFTAPVSAANKAAREEAARKAVIEDAASFEELKTDGLPASVVSVYRGLDGSGKTLGYIFTVEGKGFGGKIQVMCAIGPEGKILKCQTLDISGETKTLGGQTAAPTYTNQYTGQSAGLTGVDGISGATITSNAYKGCVQDAFKAYDMVKGAE